MNFWFDFSVVFAEEGNLMWIRKIYAGKCVLQKLQNPIHKIIQYPASWNTIWHWNENQVWDICEWSSHVVMWFWALCVFYWPMKKPKQNLKQQPEKSFLILCARCVCKREKICRIYEPFLRSRNALNLNGNRWTKERDRERMSEGE